MKAKKILFVALTASMLLASCGGKSSASPIIPVPTPSSTGESSDTSSSSSSSSSTETDPTSSTITSTSSDPEGDDDPIPTTTTFNAYNVTYKLVKELRKYDDTVRVSKIAKELAMDSGESIDFSLESETRLTEGFFALIFYVAIKDVLPERIGARSFQGFYFDPDTVELRRFVNNEKDGYAYQALTFLSQTGIFHVPATTSLSAAKAFSDKNLNKYIDRLHAYFGTSLKDDFFSTVNHDYLYDNNPYEDVPADGRKSWDEPYDEDNLTNIYDSRLIPEETIVDWALEFVDQIPEAKTYVDLYKDFSTRVPGNGAGMIEGIREYLAAQTPAEFIEVCRKQALENGYCILWSEAETGKYTYAGKNLLTVTSYNYSGTASEAVSGRAESVARFKPIFGEAMDLDEEVALKYAEDYSDFKIAMTRHKAADPESDTVRLLTDDEEEYQKTPTLYTMATFSTGESLQHFFETLGFTKKSIVFASSQDIRAIVDLIKEDTLDVVKGMAIWQMLQHYTICLPNTPAVNAWAWKPGYGTNKETLWDNKAAFYTYGLSSISNVISNYYVATEEFERESAAVISVLDGLKDAMGRRIDAASWLSQDAKDKAHLKVDNLKHCIGGALSDGTTLEFAVPEEVTGTLYDAIGAFASVSLQEMTKQAGYSVDGAFGDYVKTINPLTANAFYMPARNGLDITLGYMAAYDDADKMATSDLFASYGWVVGHELSHGFDSNGIYYDENGNKPAEGWFLPEDQEAYSARCLNVSSYYDGYEVMPEKATNGKTVITEAIADINGLHLTMEMAKEVENFDYEAFFIKAAQNFASYASQYTYSAGGLAADEHPFGRARVNLAVKAMDEFHETFGTAEGDAMWVAPEDRIAIW